MHDIDRLVSAQIPDPERYPKLYSTVTKFMMYGLCSDLNPRCPCMEDKADVVHKELLLRRRMCRVMIKRFGTSPYILFFSAELHLI